MKCSRPWLDPLLLALLFLFAAPLLAQTTKARPPASSNPPARAAAVAAEEVPQAEAFARLKELNDERKFVATAEGPGQYTRLEQENCHGWRLSGGARLLWESAGWYYGMTLTGLRDLRTLKTYENIGIVYAETDFRLGNKIFHKGPYMVFARPEELWLSTETEEGERIGQGLPLQNKLDPTEFDKTANKAPRFTFVQKKHGLFLKIGENLLAVSPQ